MIRRTSEARGRVYRKLSDGGGGVGGGGDRISGLTENLQRKQGVLWEEGRVGGHSGP